MPSVTELTRSSKRCLNPLTVLGIAVATWILVIGFNSPWLSVAVVVASWLIATVKLKNLSVVWTTLVLAVPVFLSMVVIHGLFGEDRSELGVFTTDGLLLAAELGVRFTALMATMLTAMALMDVSSLVKALQGSGVHPKFGYVLGSAVQLLPQGSQTIARVKDARRLKGLPEHKVRGVVMPVVVNTMSQAADRAVAVEVSGLDLAGKRTVVRPVYDSDAQRFVRWIAPVAALIAVAVTQWI